MDGVQRDRSHDFVDELADPNLLVREALLVVLLSSCFLTETATATESCWRLMGSPFSEAGDVVGAEVDDGQGDGRRGVSGRGGLGGSSSNISISINPVEYRVKLDFTKS